LESDSEKRVQVLPELYLFKEPDDD